MTEVAARFARAAAAAAWAVEMRPALKATVMRVDVAGGRQDGHDGGVAGGVPVSGVMRGRLSVRGHAATAAVPPATGAWPGRSAARSPGRRATA